MASTTADFYIDANDGWVAVAGAADLNIIKGPRSQPWSLYVGASPPSTSATAASVNLSYSGRPTAATKAVATLTFEDDAGAGDAVVEDDTVELGSVTYTFKNVPAAAGEVLVGADNLESAANLVAAIQGDALNDPHPQFEASAASLVVTVTALLVGTAVNAVATVATSDGMAFGAATPVDGVAGETITLAGAVYTFVVALSKPAHVAGGVANEVLAGANAAGDYNNIAAAVNGTGTEGTTYGTDTVSRPSNIFATNDGVDDIVFAAGPSDNGIAVSEALSNASFDGGLTALAGGAPAPRGMTFGSQSWEDNHEMALPNLDGTAYVRVLGEVISLPGRAPLHFAVITIST